MIVVLDASAIIAMLLFEPGWESVAEVHSDSLASSVNIAEVVTKLSERGLADEDARLVISKLELSIVDFDTQQAVQAGLLRRATRARGLSLGDRACLGLALARGVRVLTTDRVWAGLKLGIEIEVIR